MTGLIDTYRDAFLLMLSEGMSHAEALAQFDREKWNAAVGAEIDLGSCQYNPETFQYVTRDGKPSLLDLAAAAGAEDRESNDMTQAIELWLAGWKSENPNPKYPCQTMSLYWRRPPKRKGKLGRRFLSTNQAHNALKREPSL